MLVWYDFEFIEDGHTIEPISLGMVAEDGRELYHQNRDCHFKQANEWVRRNVYPHLQFFDLQRLKPINGPYDAPNARQIWCSRDGLRDAVMRFCDPEKYGPLELWADYAAYDHVALCQLFGRMIELPPNWPMYTNDLQQALYLRGKTEDELPQQVDRLHNALADARHLRAIWKYLNPID